MGKTKTRSDFHGLRGATDGRSGRKFRTTETPTIGLEEKGGNRNSPPGRGIFMKARKFGSTQFFPTKETFKNTNLTNTAEKKL